MDIVTHAISGSLVALVLPQRPRLRFFLPFFAVVACLPDIDILFGRSPSLFLNLHRGITHALVALPVLAFAASLLPWIFRKKETAETFSFRGLWLSCLVCLVIHVALDCVTTYGTMIFLPFSPVRVRLNAVFIVDLFLSVPMLVLLITALIRKKSAGKLACAGLVWMTLYPSICLGLNQLATEAVHSRLEAENRHIEDIVLLPDFFTPLFWRAVFIERVEDDRALEMEASVSGLGQWRGPAIAHTPLPENQANHMAAQSEIAADFLNLMLMPVVRPLPEKHREAALVALSFLPPKTGAEQGEKGAGHAIHPVDEKVANTLQFLLVYDLRFGSGLAIGRELLGRRPRANIPFRLMVVLDKDDNVLLERVVFSDARQDSGWTPPEPPRPQTLGQWLLGIR